MQLNFLRHDDLPDVPPRYYLSAGPRTATERIAWRVAEALYVVVGPFFWAAIILTFVAAILGINAPT
jgi:hypothetical protein